MSKTTIEAGNLRLVAYSPEHLLALVDGETQFAKSFGLPAAVGLRAFLGSEDVSPVWLARLRASVRADPWVHGFAIVHREKNMVIGNVGFKGPPDEEGVVEIAYGIVGDFQGRGFATEATEAAVAFAFGFPQVRIVRAHTLPEPNASTRVLSKCGFKKIDEVVDPDDGPVWRWDLHRGTAQSSL